MAKDYTMNYNNKPYKAIKLLNYFLDVDLPEYKTGEVTSDKTGEIFDIEDLPNVVYKALRDMVTDSTGIFDTDFMNSATNTVKNKIKQLYIQEFRDKFNSDEIKVTVEDITAWLSYLKKSERDNFCVPKYKDFVIINKGKPKPDDMARADYSRFNELLFIMNKGCYSLKHSNGRSYSKKCLSEELDLTLKSFDNFIVRLKKFNMIAKVEGKKRGEFYIVINPVYAMRGVKINSTVYTLFKDDLDTILSPIEKEYLSLTSCDIADSCTAKITS